MKNPFKHFEKQYIWYCISCSAVGRVGINPNTFSKSSIEETCHNIHTVTTTCKALVNRIKVIDISKKK